MYIPIGKPKSIDELTNLYPSKNEKSKKTVKIIIIDDSPFSKLAMLQNHDYNIKQIPDITDLSAVSDYQIVISDIRGVGSSFGSSIEGAHVLKRLKKEYPSKALCAYTGSAYDENITKALSGIKIIKKDATIDEWCDEIDSMIEDVSHPIKVWNKVRDLLLSKGVSTYQVALFEDLYVRQALKHDVDESSFKSLTTKWNINEDIRAIINSMIAGIILSI